MARTQRVSAAVAATLLSGCTLISGVNDYEVDPSKVVRDLSFSFVGMVAHAGDPESPADRSGFLDVAVVDEEEFLQARARIILPPVESGSEYPDEELVLHNGLTPGAQRLYFYADSDGDGEVDRDDGKLIEHAWIEEVDPDGVGEFVHNTNFAKADDFLDAFMTLNGGFVLEMPVAQSMTEAAFLACLEKKLGDTVDVTLTLIEQDRQVGLIRRHRGTPVPKAIRLDGVLDGGSMYRIDVLLDGKQVKTLERRAPEKADLTLKAIEWFPADLTSARDCR